MRLAFEVADDEMTVGKYEILDMVAHTNNKRAISFINYMLRDILNEGSQTQRTEEEQKQRAALFGIPVSELV